MLVVYAQLLNEFLYRLNSKSYSHIYDFVIGDKMANYRRVYRERTTSVYTTMKGVAGSSSSAARRDGRAWRAGAVDRVDDGKHVVSDGRT